MANGTSTFTITATVLHNGAGANGDPVTFTVGNPQPAGTCGTIAAGPVVTNLAGVASTTYTMYNAVGSPTSGFCTVTATEALGTTSGSAQVVQTAKASTATSVAVNATPSTIPADNVTTSVVTATVTGASNSPVLGDEVEFTLSPSPLAPGSACFGNASPQYATTGATGIATYPGGIKSSVPGTCTVTAVESNAAQVGTTVITVNPTVYSVTVAASPSSLTGNGVTTSTITATVLNTTGAPTAGDTVTLTVVAPNGGTCGTLPAVTVTTNASGQAVITYTSSTHTLFCTVFAHEATTGVTSPVPAQIDQTSI